MGSTIEYKLPPNAHQQYFDFCCQWHFDEYDIFRSIFSISIPAPLYGEK
jgi:hypothetical protein